MNLSLFSKIPFKLYAWFLNIQFINLLFPLISIPYLLRTIGPEKYGLIAIAGSVTAILNTICDYGNAFTGIRDVSRISDDVSSLSSYIINNIAIRILIFTLCLGIFIFLVIFIPFAQQEFLLFSTSIVIILPNLVYPQWLFVGLQRMEVYNSIILGNKILSTILIFILIRNPADYSIYPLAQLIPAMVSAIICVRFLYQIGLRFRYSDIKNIRSQLSEGALLFVSQSITSIYVQLNPVLLMLLLQNAVLVGYYAVAEKIVNIVKSFISPLNQLSLPLTSQQFANAPRDAWKNIKALALLILLVNTLAIITLVLLAPTVVSLIGGDNFSDSILTVRLLAPMMLFVGLNNLAGVHILLNTNMKKEFIYGILCGVCVNTGLMYLLYPSLLHNAPAISWTFAEFIVLVYFSIVIMRRFRKSLL